MTHDPEYGARKILAHTLVQCRILLDLVDLAGEAAAFKAIKESLPGYNDAVMKRMLLASRGAAPTELFSIAKEIFGSMAQQ